MDHAPLAVGIASLVLASTLGCRTRTNSRRTTIALHPDMQLVNFPDVSIQLLDIRLGGRLRAEVVASNVARIGGNHVGDAKTVAEWVRERRALAGVNGGFFGETYDAAGRRRQIVQLAVVNGMVVAPGGAVEARVDGRRERYLRSAVGFTADGSPRMEWSAGTSRLGPRKADKPIAPYQVRPWDIDSAVACGPRLIHRGNIEVCDRQERLRNTEPAPRTFVAYDAQQGQPSRLILGCGDNLRYPDVARFLQRYCSERHGSHIAEAMCLDGGASSQLVYKDGESLVDARPTGVFVPTAIIVTEVS
jgi:hypothetical protein